MSSAPDAPNQTGERRRFPRHAPPVSLELTMPIVTQGEVMDVSESGALLSTPMEMAVGDRTRLSLLVGREPFSALARVVRSELGTRAGRTVRYHVGLIFTSIDDHNRQVIQRFVRRDPPR